MQQAVASLQVYPFAIWYKSVKTQSAQSAFPEYSDNNLLHAPVSI